MNASRVILPPTSSLCLLLLTYTSTDELLIGLLSCQDAPLLPQRTGPIVSPTFGLLYTIHHSRLTQVPCPPRISWHLSFELPLSPGDACHSNYALLHLPVLTHICMGIPKATFRQRTGTQSLGNEGSKGFWLLDIDTRSAVLKNRKKVAFPKK